MKIRFLGATRQVTGSSYFLDAGGVKILVDCGLFQERDCSVFGFAEKSFFGGKELKGKIETNHK